MSRFQSIPILGQDRNQQILGQPPVGQTEEPPLPELPNLSPYVSPRPEPFTPQYLERVSGAANAGGFADFGDTLAQTFINVVPGSLLQTASDLGGTALGGLANLVSQYLPGSEGRSIDEMILHLETLAADQQAMGHPDAMKTASAANSLKETISAIRLEPFRQSLPSLTFGYGSALTGESGVGGQPMPLDREQFAATLADPEGWAPFLGGITSSVAMSAMMVANPAFVPAVLTSFGSMGYAGAKQSYYDIMESRGFTPDEDVAIGVGVAGGLFELASEYIGLDIVPEALQRRIIARLAMAAVDGEMRTVSKTVARTLAQTGAAASVESIEEAVAQIGSNISVLVGDMMTTGEVPTRSEAVARITDGIGEAMLGGFIAGGAQAGAMIAPRTAQLEREVYRRAARTRQERNNLGDIDGIASVEDDVIADAALGANLFDFTVNGARISRKDAAAEANRRGLSLSEQDLSSAETLKEAVQDPAKAPMARAALGRLAALNAAGLPADQLSFSRSDIRSMTGSPSAGEFNSRAARRRLAADFVQRVRVPASPAYSGQIGDISIGRAGTAVELARPEVQAPAGSDERLVSEFETELNSEQTLAARGGRPARIQAVAREELNEDHRRIEQDAAKRGVRVVWWKGDTGDFRVGGAQLPSTPNTVFLRHVAADEIGRDGMRDYYLGLVSHEATHDVELSEQGASDVRALLEAALPNFSSMKYKDKVEWAVARGYDPEVLSEENIDSEIAAILNENTETLRRSGALSLITSDRSRFGKALDYIRRALTRMGFSGPEAKAVLQFITRSVERPAAAVAEVTATEEREDQAPSLDARYSASTGWTGQNGIYLKVARVLEEFRGKSGQKKMRTADLLGVLSRNGVKQDEMYWSGLLEYVRGKDEVDLAQLQSVLRAPVVVATRIGDEGSTGTTSAEDDPDDQGASGSTVYYFISPQATDDPQEIHLANLEKIFELYNNLSHYSGNFSGQYMVFPIPSGANGVTDGLWRSVLIQALASQQTSLIDIPVLVPIVGSAAPVRGLYMTSDSRLVSFDAHTEHQQVGRWRQAYSALRDSLNVSFRPYMGNSDAIEELVRLSESELNEWPDQSIEVTDEVRNEVTNSIRDFLNSLGGRDSDSLVSSMFLESVSDGIVEQTGGQYNYYTNDESSEDEDGNDGPRYEDYISLRNRHYGQLARYDEVIVTFQPYVNADGSHVPAGGPGTPTEAALDFSFESEHFEGAADNYIGHIRGTLRYPIIDGREPVIRVPIYLVEEIQSDLFQNDYTAARADVLETMLEAAERADVRNVRTESWGVFNADQTRDGVVVQFSPGARGGFMVYPTYRDGRTIKGRKRDGVPIADVLERASMVSVMDDRDGAKILAGHVQAFVTAINKPDGTELPYNEVIGKILSGDTFEGHTGNRVAHRVKLASERAEVVDIFTKRSSIVYELDGVPGWKFQMELAEMGDGRSFVESRFNPNYGSFQALGNIGDERIYRDGRSNYGVGSGSHRTLIHNAATYATHATTAATQHVSESPIGDFVTSDDFRIAARKLASQQITSLARNTMSAPFGSSEAYVDFAMKKALVQAVAAIDEVHGSHPDAVGYEGWFTIVNGLESHAMWGNFLSHWYESVAQMAPGPFRVEPAAAGRDADGNRNFRLNSAWIGSGRQNAQRLLGLEGSGEFDPTESSPRADLYNAIRAGDWVEVYQILGKHGDAETLNYSVTNHSQLRALLGPEMYAQAAEALERGLVFEGQFPAPKALRTGLEINYDVHATKAMRRIAKALGVELETIPENDFNHGFGRTAIRIDRELRRKLRETGMPMFSAGRNRRLSLSSFETIIRERFGDYEQVSYITDATGFILASGHPVQMGEGSRWDDHRAIVGDREELLSLGVSEEAAKQADEGTRTPALLELMSIGDMIRTNVAGNTMTLEMHAASGVTSAQRQIIADYVDEARPRYVAIEVIRSNGSTRVREFDSPDGSTIRDALMFSASRRQSAFLSRHRGQLVGLDLSKASPRGFAALAAANGAPVTMQEVSGDDVEMFEIVGAESGYAVRHVRDDDGNVVSSTVFALNTAHERMPLVLEAMILHAASRNPEARISIAITPSQDDLKAVALIYGAEFTFTQDGTIYADLTNAIPADDRRAVLARGLSAFSDFRQRLQLDPAEDAGLVRRDVRGAAEVERESGDPVPQPDAVRGGAEEAARAGGEVRGTRNAVWRRVGKVSRAVRRRTAQGVAAELDRTPFVLQATSDIEMSARAAYEAARSAHAAAATEARRAESELEKRVGKLGAADTADSAAVRRAEKSVATFREKRDVAVAARDQALETLMSAMEDLRALQQPRFDEIGLDWMPPSVSPGVSNSAPIGEIVPGMRESSVQTIATALHAHSLNIVGTFRDDETAIANVITFAMFREIDAAMRAGGTAAEWYGSMIEETLRVWTRAYPGKIGTRTVAQRRNREILMMVLAITSNGERVAANAAHTRRVMERYFRTGVLEIEERVGEGVDEKGKEVRESVQRAGAMNNSFRAIMAMTSLYGIEATVEMLNTRGTSRKEMLAIAARVRKELKDARDSGRISIDNESINSISFSSDIPDGYPMQFSQIFGPKIGAFYANLHGNFDILTADLWFTRTYAYYAGYLAAVDIPTVRSRVQEMEALTRIVSGEDGYAGPRIVRVAKKDRNRIGKDELSVEDIRAAAKAVGIVPEIMRNGATFGAYISSAGATFVAGKDGKAYNELAFDGVKDLDAAGRAAARAILHGVKAIYEGDPTINEAPDDSRQRGEMAATTRRALEMFNRNVGSTNALTVAAAQAKLWYWEKDVYYAFNAGPRGEGQDFRSASLSVLSDLLPKRSVRNGRQARFSAGMDRIRAMTDEERIVNPDVSSAIVQAVEPMQEKASIEQVMAFVAKSSSANSEAKWIGLEDKLAELGTKTVTRSQVVDIANSNLPTVVDRGSFVYQTVESTPIERDVMPFSTTSPLFDAFMHRLSERNALADAQNDRRFGGDTGRGEPGFTWQDASEFYILGGADGYSSPFSFVFAHTNAMHDPAVPALGPLGISTGDVQQSIYNGFEGAAPFRTRISNAKIRFDGVDQPVTFHYGIQFASFVSTSTLSFGQGISIASENHPDRTSIIDMESGFIHIGMHSVADIGYAIRNVDNYDDDRAAILLDAYSVSLLVEVSTAMPVKITEVFSEARKRIDEIRSEPDGEERLRYLFGEIPDPVELAQNMYRRAMDAWKAIRDGDLEAGAQYEEMAAAAAEAISYLAGMAREETIDGWAEYGINRALRDEKFRTATGKLSARGNGGPWAERLFHTVDTFGMFSTQPKSIGYARLTAMVSSAQAGLEQHVETTYLKFQEQQNIPWSRGSVRYQDYATNGQAYGEVVLGIPLRSMTPYITEYTFPDATADIEADLGSSIRWSVAEMPNAYTAAFDGMTDEQLFAQASAATNEQFGFAHFPDDENYNSHLQIAHFRWTADDNDERFMVEEIQSDLFQRSVDSEKRPATSFDSAGIEVYTDPGSAPPDVAALWGRESANSDIVAIVRMKTDRDGGINRYATVLRGMDNRFGISTQSAYVSETPSGQDWNFVTGTYGGLNSIVSRAVPSSARRIANAYSVMSNTPVAFNTMSAAIAAAKYLHVTGWGEPSGSVLPAAKSWPEVSMRMAIQKAAQLGFTSFGIMNSRVQLERYGTDLAQLDVAIEENQREGRRVYDLSMKIGYNDHLGVDFDVDGNAVTERRGGQVRYVTHSVSAPDAGPLELTPELAMEIRRVIGRAGFTTTVQDFVTSTMKKNWEQILAAESDLHFERAIRLEGMRHFYDRTMRSNLDKFAKKFGVRVQDGVYHGKPAFFVTITPEMRESILGGTAMFSASGGPWTRDDLYAARRDVQSSWIDLKIFVRRNIPNPRFGPRDLENMQLEIENSDLEDVDRIDGFLKVRMAQHEQDLDPDDYAELLRIIANIRRAVANKAVIRRALGGAKWSAGKRTLRGEWWIRDGQAEFADDYANHEGVARSQALTDMFDLLRDDPEYSGFMDLARENEWEDLDSWLDVSPSEIQHQIAMLVRDGRPVERSWNVADIVDGWIDGIVAKRGGEDPNRIRVMLQTATGLRDDYRDYAFELGWIRVAGNNLEVRGLTDAKLRQLADGVYDIMGEEALTQVFTLEDTMRDRIFHDVPFSALERGVRGLIPYRGGRIGFSASVKAAERASPGYESGEASRYLMFDDRRIDPWDTADVSAHLGDANTMLAGDGRKSRQAFAEHRRENPSTELHEFLVGWYGYSWKGLDLEDEGNRIASTVSSLASDAGFRKWFGKSRATSVAGGSTVPTPLLHAGAAGDSLDMFATASESGELLNPIPFAVKIENPLELPDAASRPDHLAVTRGLPREVMDTVFAEAYPFADSSSRQVDLRAMYMSSAIDRIAERAATAGYDGLSYMDGETRVYIPFMPTSVRAMDSATFPETRFSAGRSVTFRSGFLMNTRTMFQDSYIKLEKALEDLELAHGEIPSTMNPLLAIRRMPGAIAARQKTFREGTVNPLLRQMREIGLSMRDIGEILYALHATERNAYVEKINPGSDMLGSGMSNERAAAVIAAIPSLAKRLGVEPSIILDIAVAWQRIANETLDVQRAAGLIREDDYINLTSVYQNYVPMYGAPVDSGPALEKEVKRFSLGGKQLRQTVGGAKDDASDADFEAVIVHIVGQRELVMSRAYRNIVANRFLELVKAKPAPGLWSIYTPGKVRVMNVQKGVVEEVEDNSWREDPRVMEVLVIVPTTVRETEIVDGKPRTVERIVERGQQVLVRIEDEQLGRILTRGNVPSQHWAMAFVRMGRMWSGWVRMFATSAFNPDFMLTNPVRDTQTAIATVATEQDQAAAISKRMFTVYPKAFKEVMNAVYGRKPGELRDLWNQFERLGARQSLFTPQDFDERFAELVAQMQDPTISRNARKKAFSAVVGFWDNLNSVFDNSIRFAFFVSAVEAGVDPEKASVLARNLTVDFSKRGSETGVIAGMYAFANAGVQGTAKTIKLLRTRRGRQIMGGLFAAGFLQAMLTHLLADDDEDRNGIRDALETKEYIHDTNMVFPTGMGFAAKIPLSYGLNIPWVMGRKLYQAMSGQKPAAVAIGECVNASLATFNPLGGEGIVDGGHGFLRAIAPDVLDVPIDLATGKDWRGNPLYKVSPWDRDPVLSEMGSNRTPDAVKWFSRTMNRLSGGDYATPGLLDFHPDAVQYMFQQITGGTGRAVERVIRSIGGMVDGDLDVADVPGLRRFVEEYPTDSNAMNSYYTLRDEVAGFEARLDRYETERERGQARGENPGLSRAITPFKNAEKEIKKLRARRRELETRNASDAVLETIDRRMMEIRNRAVRDATARTNR